MDAQPAHRHGCYQDAPAQQETHQDLALNSLSPSPVFLPEASFAWLAAAFSCENLIASLHTLQLSKHCIFKLESSLRKKEVNKIMKMNL